MKVLMVRNNFIFLIYVMENWVIEKQEFEIKLSTTADDLLKLKKKFEWLKINWINDTTWYIEVKNAWSSLKNTRIYITKTLKDYRSDAIAFQKSCIKQEKDLCKIIDETEQMLKDEKTRIDDLINIEKRKKLLPERQRQCIECLLDLSNEEILVLNDKKFEDMIMKRRSELFEIQQEKLRIEQEKMEKEKREMEIRKEEQQRAIKEKEEAIQKEKEMHELKIKQQKEEYENKIRLEKEEKERKIKQQKEKNELIIKNKAYQQWLIDNKFNEWTDIVQERDWTPVLYRMVSIFNN